MSRSTRLTLFALLVIAGSQARAQIVTGTISGTVTDPSGGVIPGATVTLTNQRTRDVRTLSTNEAGRFSFAAVQPGTYSLKIERSGFQTLVRSDVVLSANENLALGELQLQPGQVSETVTVTSQGAVVETESSDLSSRLTADQIELISVKGRNVTSLLRTMPGVTYEDDSDATGESFGQVIPNIGGMRARSALATVDGLMGNDVSGSNRLSHTINMDAIAEVKVLLNNYAAEYGNQGGAQINVVTKSGGRDYHGSAYYYIRNEALNANNFFNNKNGLPRPLYRHNTWGANLGGPVQIPKLFPNRDRKRLFFFYSIERPYTITPVSPVRVTVPTERERRGDFSQTFTQSGQLIVIRDPLTGQPFPGNIIPPDRINKSGQALLNFFPLPNAQSSFAQTGTNYVMQESLHVPKLSNVARVDFRTDKDTIYWKGQTWLSDTEGYSTPGWPSGATNRWGVLKTHYRYSDNGMTINWTRVLNQRMVNEAFVGLRHSMEEFIPSDGELNRILRSTLGYTAPQLYPDQNPLGIIPRVTSWGGVPNAANINWVARLNSRGADLVGSFTDNFSFIQGTHSYKAGLYIEHLRNDEGYGGDWSGSFSFQNDSNNPLNTGYAYANALLGIFRSYSETNSRNRTNARLTLVQWYGQDTWKVNRRLTLNYGLRMGFHTQWYQADKRAAGFVLERWDPAKAPLLYGFACTTPIPPNGTCPSANRRAINPVTKQLLPLAFAGAIVPGTGDPYNGMVVEGDPNYPKGFKELDGVQWEPRAGFAWDLFGTGRTVFRAMGGIYHSPRVGGGSVGNLTPQPPLQINQQIFYGYIDQLGDLLGSAVLFPDSVLGLERYAKTPSSYNFMIGIQQNVGFGTVLSVSYVSTLGRHLGERRNINQVPDGARFLDLHPENRNPVTGSVYPDNFLRPYRGYGSIQIDTYSGSSNYHAMQVEVSRRYARGLQFGLAYTWSKAMDFANDDTSDVSLGRPYRAWNYGPADFDQTHIFSFNYIWDIPNLSRVWDTRLVRALFDGWQLSGITSLVTGKPFTPSMSTQPSFDITGGSVGARPNMLHNPNLSEPKRAADGTPVFVDASAFARPARGDFGNMPRNVARLPGVNNWDMSLFKNIRLGEKRNLQLRWEAYNVFNHANFNAVDTQLIFDANGNQINANFGAATSARPPRVMQGSIRFSF
ncbi:TonB-dependent receptor [Pyrinomonas methylaliphatogenes]|uniref:Outer membrane receptor for ferrienterochelin and colicins n=1 Tax=Pyrinomonas methylaliphatogenes TaxID=454194 RepID=A0A0B6WUU2_9BACT|nr:carboxypeptidase regulatory-like domain-containing protein [Pyrinomonas methylaliphatogenes]CDM65033.1 outer membrane receptor for ferrienterochelin and colicins [Pyrinomonas methylaliphatogenes]